MFFLGPNPECIRGASGGIGPLAMSQPEGLRTSFHATLFQLECRKIFTRTFGTRRQKSNRSPSLPQTPTVETQQACSRPLRRKVNSTEGGRPSPRYTLKRMLITLSRKSRMSFFRRSQTVKKDAYQAADCESSDQNN
jgi:hypothetical protein